MRVLRSAAGLAVLLAVYRSDGLAAQVGHDPGHSPFRDVAHGTTLRYVTGYFAGGRGTVPVGMTGGPTFGLRLETPLGRVTTFAFGLAYGQTNRFIVNPLDSASHRRTGPIDCDVVMADLGLQFSLTGGKTFHGFAPYFGTTLGLAFGSELPADTSGYHFGTKLTVGPGVGVRWYPARRLSVQADVRALLWKLSYPLSYKEPGADGTRVLSLTAPETDWTTYSWISLGVGWTF